MEIRPAVPSDAPAMSVMLEQLVAAGKRTSPADETFVLSHYIANPEGISCSVALDADERSRRLARRSVSEVAANVGGGAPRGRATDSVRLLRPLPPRKSQRLSHAKGIFYGRSCPSNRADTSLKGF